MTTIENTTSENTKMDSTDMNTQFDHMIDKLTDSISTMKTLIQEVKILKKEHAKNEKASRKKVKKEKDPNRPAPFTKPVKISDELRTFLKKEDEDISRTEVTQMMYAYIKENNLQNPENKRQFILNDVLATLFKLNKDESMEYFKLQTHMKQHYPPKES